MNPQKKANDINKLLSDIAKKDREKLISDSKLFPLFLYIYGHDGFHDRAIRINNSEELERYFYNEVALAISEKREVRITDTDDMMVFHCAMGKIIFDGAKHYGDGKELKDFDN